MGFVPAQRFLFSPTAAGAKAPDGRREGQDRTDTQGRMVMMKRVKRWLAVVLAFMIIVGVVPQRAEAAYYRGNLYYLYVNGEYTQSGVSADRDRAFRALVTNKMVNGRAYSTFFFIFM